PADFSSRATQDDDHLVQPRRSLGLIYDPAEQGAPSEGKKLFGLPEAARSSRAENQPGDKFPIHKQSTPFQMPYAIIHMAYDHTSISDDNFFQIKFGGDCPNASLHRNHCCSRY